MQISRRSGDDIASNFAKIINSLQKPAPSQESLEKVAQEISSTDEISLDDPESFLVSENVDPDAMRDGSLESEIETMSSYAKDGAMENHADDCVGCETCKPNEIESMIDKSAQNLLFGLGKIASDLRNKNENFAADMVDATALGIIKDLTKEAEKKLVTVTKLKKIASEIENKDSLAIELIDVTIGKILKNASLEAGPSYLDILESKREALTKESEYYLNEYRKLQSEGKRNAAEMAKAQWDKVDKRLIRIVMEIKNLTNASASELDMPKLPEPDVVMADSFSEDK